MTPPEDLRAPWLNAARRMQQVACNEKALSVITFQVVVAADGNPIFYADPQVRRLEPRQKAAQFLEEILRYIT